MFEFLRQRKVAGERSVVLPNLLIIGANKAGTTSLAYYLSQHPEIFVSKVKEPMFFTSHQPTKTSMAKSKLDDLYYSFTLAEYSSLFRPNKGEAYRFEASTSYLANPECSLWMQKMIPGVKLIAMLRNPITRAYSCYKMYHGNGIETRSFEEAIDDEINGRMEGVPQGQHYLWLGCYGKQIETFRKRFAAKQMLIMDYDDYSKDLEGSLERIYGFLELAPAPLRDDAKLNTTSDHYQSKTEVPKPQPETLRILKDYYREDVQLLQQYVDFDATAWLEVESL